MDTARAKNIIIILFIALNLFLLVNVVLQVTGNNISGETLENTRTILEERGVTFANGVKIPVFRKDVPAVLFGESGADREKVESVLLGAEVTLGSIRYEGDYIFKYTDPAAGIKTTSGDGSDPSLKETQRGLKKLIERMGLPAGDFVADRQTDSEVYFIYKTENYYIFDNYILFELSNGGISYIECSYREVSGFGDPAEILPAHQVLIKNIIDCDGCVISSIDIGYKSEEQDGTVRSSDDRTAASSADDRTAVSSSDDRTAVSSADDLTPVWSSNTQTPVWRVCFTDDTCRYFSAYPAK